MSSVSAIVVSSKASDTVTCVTLRASRIDSGFRDFVPEPVVQVDHPGKLDRRWRGIGRNVEFVALGTLVGVVVPSDRPVVERFPLDGIGGDRAVVERVPPSRGVRVGRSSADYQLNERPVGVPLSECEPVQLVVYEAYPRLSVREPSVYDCWFSHQQPPQAARYLSR